MKLKKTTRITTTRKMVATMANVNCNHNVIYGKELRFFYVQLFLPLYFAHDIVMKPF